MSALAGFFVALTGGRPTLQVDDAGPGIAPADRERVFDRFYRHAAGAESGSGLGLAIVRGIAKQHAASVSLEDSALGGARFVVGIPVDFGDTSFDREPDSFEVFEAENSHVAIEILEQHPGIHVMFSDVDMPGGLDGLRLAELVRNRWPPIKIIITSGHMDLTNLVAHYIEKVLPKPYSPEKVVDAIRELVE